MLHGDLAKLNIDEKEIMAFVQQQMVDLAPHFKDESALEFRLAQVKKGYLVELVANHQSGTVQTVGQDQDLFSAIRQAKEGLLEYCVAAEDELNPELRAERVEQILRGPGQYLH